MVTKLMEFSKSGSYGASISIILEQKQVRDLRFVDINGDGLINASDRTNRSDPFLKRLWI
jgi:hypothetical protein